MDPLSSLEAEYQARKAAKKAGVDPDLFARLVQRESGYNPDAVSPRGAIGLAQLMPATAAELGVDPNDPIQNLEGGARYLGQQVERFGTTGGLAAYNAGPGAVQKYGGVPPFPETQKYVQAIGGGVSDLEAEYQARKTSRGNIDLSNRPAVKNPDGTVSSVLSKSFGFDGQEVLLPTVSDDGRIMTDAEAIAQYKQTGRHLGKFASPDEATAYAKRLHEDQARGVDTLTGGAIPTNQERIDARLKEILKAPPTGTAALGVARGALAGIPELVGSTERTIGGIVPGLYQRITGRPVTEPTPFEQLGQQIAPPKEYATGAERRAGATERIATEVGRAIPQLPRFGTLLAISAGATTINEIKEHLGLGPEHAMGQEVWNTLSGLIPALPAYQSYRQATADPNLPEPDKDRAWDDFIEHAAASGAVGLPMVGAMARAGLKRSGVSADIARQRLAEPVPPKTGGPLPTPRPASARSVEVVPEPPVVAPAVPPPTAAPEPVQPPATLARPSVAEFKTREVAGTPTTPAPSDTAALREGLVKRGFAPDMLSKIGRKAEASLWRAFQTVPPELQESFVKDVNQRLLSGEPVAFENVPRARLISDAAKNDAVKRLNEKLSRVSTGVPLDAFSDLATIGAHYLESGALKFADWSKEMIGAVGERIQPHLERIWAEANRLWKDTTGSAGALADLRRHTRQEPIKTEEPKLGGAAKYITTEFAPLREAEATLREINRLPAPEMDIARRMELAAYGAKGQAEADYIKYQRNVLTDLVADVPMNQRVLKAGPDYNERIRKLHDYLTAKRIIDRLTDDPEVKAVEGWDIPKAQAALRGLESEVGPELYRRLETAGRRFQDEANADMERAVASGRLSRERADLTRAHNDFYAPFKVLAHQADVQAGVGPRIASTKDFSKRIVGITSEDWGIQNIVDAMGAQKIRNRILDEKNLAMLEVDRLADLDAQGTLVKRVVPETHRSVTPSGELTTTESLPKPREGYKVVSFLKNGEPAHLEVPKDIAGPLEGLGKTQTSILMNAMGKSAILWRLGVTGANVSFWVRNLPNDVKRSMVMSKYGITPTTALRVPMDYVYGLYSAARGNLGKPNDAYIRFLSSGAALSNFTRMMYPGAFEGKAQTRAGRVLQMAGRVVPGVASSLEEAAKVGTFIRGERAELAQKPNVRDVASLMSLSGVKKLIKGEAIGRPKGLRPEERAELVRQIASEVRNYGGSPDFARGTGVTREASVLYPFFNARLQGITGDIARSYGAHGGKLAATVTARRALLIWLPATAIYFLNHTPDNEKDYDDIDARDKGNWYHIPRSEYFTNRDGAKVRDYWRIPKKDTEKVDANVIEAALDMLRKDDPQAFAKMRDSFLDEYLPISLSGATTQERLESFAGGVHPVPKTIAEVGSGRDFYRHRGIIPERMQGAASPELQVRPTTPEIYRQAGKLTGLSPLVAEHAMKGLTGSLVTQFVPPESSRSMAANPITRPFIRSEYVSEEPEKTLMRQAQGEHVDARLRAQQAAESEATRIKTLSPTEQGRAIFELARKDAALAKKVMDIKKDEARGIGWQDRAVKSLGVADMTRARYIIGATEKMSEAERAEYLRGLAMKGILTPQVRAQVEYLRRRRVAQ